MWLRLGAAVAAIIVSAGAVDAADYPGKPVRLLVPYAAGGPSDAGARLITGPLGQSLGGTVFVENRGGAGGLTGTEQVVQGQHDGHTLLLGAIGPLVFIPAARQVQYDVKRDLVPLGLIWQSPLVLVVNPKRGFKSGADLVAYAKANPGKLSVASAGLGTNTHMASELFKREAGIDLLHVPYRSTGAALPDLLSGQVDATISDVALMAPHVRQGNLTALAVTAPERSPLLPEVPSMAEAGLSGALTENWYGLLAPTRTPPEVIAKLKAALDAAVKTAAFREGLARQGAVIRASGADAFAALIDSETKRWAPVIRDAGVKF
ncbi:MAG: tripartite tricarboxylate transporter substrate binding protein [Hyphomicrobiales bacterium]|nr:tripartite tricarboxylate transporter substrate binding protein [Hyphomicrobiales bacterium]